MITDKEAIEAWNKIKELLNYLYYTAPEDLGVPQRQLCRMLDYDPTTYNKYKQRHFSIDGVPLKSIDQLVQGYASKVYKARQEKDQKNNDTNI
jgi:hypothetical protein